MEDEIIGAYSVVPLNSAVMHKAVNLEVGAYDVLPISKAPTDNVQSAEVVKVSGDDEIVEITEEEVDALVFGNVTEGQLGAVIIGGTVGTILLGPAGLVVGVAGGVILS
jgi:hypothetical protein